MKVLVAAILFLAIASKIRDQADASPGFGALGAFFKGLGTAAKAATPAVAKGVDIASTSGKIANSAGRTATNLARAGPKVTTSLARHRGTSLVRYTKAKHVTFKTKIRSKAGPVVPRVKHVGRGYTKPAKARTMDGIAMSSRYMKHSKSNFKNMVRNSFRKRTKSKTVEAKQDSSGLANELSLPYDKNGTPLDVTLQGGGPDSPPPAKRGKLSKSLAAAASGTSRGLELAGTATGVALQAQSLKTITSVVESNKKDSAGAIESTSSIVATTGVTEAGDAICASMPKAMETDDTECISVSNSDDDENQNNAPITSKLTYGSLELYYDDKPTSAGTFCRSNVRNLADERLSYVQAYQLKNVDAITNSELENNRNSVLNCAIANGKLPMPLSSLKPSQLRSKPPITVPNIKEVKCKGTTVLAWSGYLWDLGDIPGAPIITNTCHLDSFFTHILLKGRQDFSFFDRNFLIPQDGSEAMIKEIVKEYKALSPRASKTTIKASQYKWKELWIKTQSWEYNKLFEEKKTVDFTGHELNSVADRLEKSRILYMTFTCACDGNKNILARSVSVVAFTIEQIILFSRANQPQSDYNKPLLVSLENQLFNFCRSCKKAQLNYLFVPSTTWMLFLVLPSLMGGPFAQGKGKPYVFDLSKVPKKFIANEMFYDTYVEFELAYVSMSTVNKVSNTVYHHLSLHYFNKKFYFYDDMDSATSDGGLLTLTDNPDQVISSRQLTIESLIYFRP